MPAAGGATSVQELSSFGEIFINLESPFSTLVQGNCMAPEVDGMAARALKPQRSAFAADPGAFRPNSIESI
jgi:hypothetical protein